MEEKIVLKNQLDLNNFIIISIIILIILGLAGLKLPSLFLTDQPSLFFSTPPSIINIKVTLSGLAAALMKYESDFGVLPPHTAGTFDSKTLVIYLDGEESNGGPKKAYFEFKPEEISLITGDYLDPYGRTFHYRQPKNSDGTPCLEIINKNRFDLWSEWKHSVVDGDIKGEDDVTNWKID